MDLWSPSASQAEQYERAGYLIVPGRCRPKQRSKCAG